MAPAPFFLSSLAPQTPLKLMKTTELSPEVLASHMHAQGGLPVTVKAPGPPLQGEVGGRQWPNNESTQD